MRAAVLLALPTLLAAQAPTPRLVTRWAADVDAAHVLPGYPRPQLVRSRWQNLNGWGQYAVRDSAAAPPASRCRG